MIIEYKNLLNRKGIKPTLLAIEIISLLDPQMSSDEPYGITALYEKISSPKPSFVNYRTTLSLLEQLECIVISMSAQKNSKKTVSLAKELREEINRLVRNEI